VKPQRTQRETELTAEDAEGAERRPRPQSLSHEERGAETAARAVEGA
jgi:hypothetical protein